MSVAPPGGTVGRMTTISGTTDTPSLLTRAFVALCLADLAWFVSTGVVVHTLPLHVTGPLRGGEAAAGLAFGAFAVSALLLRPLAGRMADTWGRVPLLVAGATLCAACLVLMPYAGGVAVVVTLRVVLGVAEAAFFVASMAALMDLAPPGRTGEAISYNSLALYSGLAVGPLLGELLLRSSGFPAAWWGAAALAGAAGLIALLLAGHLAPLPARREVPGSGRAPLIHRASLPVSMAFLCSVVAMGGFLAFAALHARTLGLPASLPVAVYGAVVVVLRVAFARLPDRVRPLTLGMVALVLSAAGLTVMSLAPSAVGLLVGTVALGAGVAFSTPALFAAVFAGVPAQERGAASGTASAGLDLGLGAGPMVLGVVAAHQGLDTAFALAAAVALAGAGWVLHLRRRGAAQPSSARTTSVAASTS